MYEYLMGYEVNFKATKQGSIKKNWTWLLTTWSRVFLFNKEPGANLARPSRQAAKLQSPRPHPSIHASEFCVF